METLNPTEPVAGASQPTPRRKQKKPAPLLMDAAQAAECLGLTVSRVEELYRSGALLAVRTAGTEEHPRGIRFTEAALLAYRDSLTAYVPPTVRKRKQPSRD